MDAYVVDALRTPRAKGRPGSAMASIPAYELARQILEALVSRTGVDPYAIDDVLLGCVTQVGEQGANIAKTATMLAGLPSSVSAASLNRFCASGLSAINLAAASVASGQADVVIAGGVESCSRVPMFSDNGAWFSDPAVAQATQFVHMGVAADLVASLQEVSRLDADVYASESHRRASEAASGHQKNQRLVAIVDPVSGVRVARDSLIRPETCVGTLAQLPPLFVEAVGSDIAAGAARGAGKAMTAIHHAGNGPALADGAAAALVVNARGLERLGLHPRAHIVAALHTSADPVEMLSGNGPAISKVLARCGWAPDDVDRFEINESFAGVMVALRRELGVDRDRFNPHGGAISLGHALGATGAMMVSSTLDGGLPTDAKAIVSVCGGAGVVATTALRLLAE